MKLQRSSLAIAINSLIALGAVSPLQAAAQEADGNNDSALEKITVTSQKRVQSLQEIPTSIQAFSGEMLEENSVSDLLDMSDSLPNVHISETSSSKRIVVRGIGSGTNSGFEQSVAMFKDGIYLGRGHQAKFPFLDMQRIELVKGPQAIMFGKNATAGALTMVTNNPTGEFDGEVNLEFGSDNDRKVSGVLNIPISDDFAARLAVFRESADGYLYNIARDRDEPETESDGFRLSLEWRPTDDLTWLTKWEHGNFENKGSRYQYIVDIAGRDAQIATDPTNSGNVGYRSFLLSDDSGLDYINSVSGEGHIEGLDEGDDTSLDNLVSQITYDMNGYELSSITTYSKYDWDLSFDADYSEVPLIKQDYVENFKQFTQEFRIASPIGETLEYLVGVFYQDSELSHPNDVLLKTSLLIPNLIGTSIGTRALFEQEQKSWSTFAALTWNLNSEWKANLGLRYQHEEKDVTNLQEVYTLFEAGTPDAVQQFANTAAPAISASLSGANENNLVADRSESHLSPNFSVQWQPNKEMMLFASYGIGYKAGGFDASGLNGSTGTVIDPASGFEFEDEKATNFELGMKSSWLNNQIELNATLFRTNYEDLQVSEFNGARFVVRNAAETTVKGIEVDTRWAINDNWSMNASVALLDFEYDAFANASPTVAQAEFLGRSTQDLTGETGAFAADYSGSIGLFYETAMGDSLIFDGSLNISFIDDHFLEQDLDPITLQEGYQKANLRLAISDADEIWSVAFLARNITDELTFGQANDVPVISYAHRFLTERPRSYHLQFGYRF